MHPRQSSADSSLIIFLRLVGDVIPRSFAPMIASWDVAREEKIRITVEKTAYLLRRDLRFSALKSLLEAIVGVGKFASRSEADISIRRPSLADFWQLQEEPHFIMSAIEALYIFDEQK